MLVSPHALFRGSAPLFCALVQSRCDLARMPRGTGVIVGDMHLENVGAYRGDEGEEAVFDLNDFDEAGHGLHALDLLRLSVSVLLSGRTFGDTARESLALLERGLNHYARVISARGKLTHPARPQAIEQLIKRVEKRRAKDLLDQRAPLVAGERRFERGARYIELPGAIAERTQVLLDAWLNALGRNAPKGANRYRVVDAAQRVAGTGSLGVLRIAILVDDGEHELRIVELKQARPTSWGTLFKTRAAAEGSTEEPAARVVAASRALVERPMRRLAALPTQRVGKVGLSLFGRSLAPQEDKLDLGALDAWAEKEALIVLVFDLLARAHRRASTLAKPSAATASQLAALIDGAIGLAGDFESVALAYARL